MGVGAGVPAAPRGPPLVVSRPVREDASAGVEVPCQQRRTHCQSLCPVGCKGRPPPAQVPGPALAAGWRQVAYPKQQGASEPHWHPIQPHPQHPICWPAPPHCCPAAAVQVHVGNPATPPRAGRRERCGAREGHRQLFPYQLPRLHQHNPRRQLACRPKLQQDRAGLALAVVKCQKPPSPAPLCWGEALHWPPGSVAAPRLCGVATAVSAATAGCPAAAAGWHALDCTWGVGGWGWQGRGLVRSWRLCLHCSPG